MIGFAFRVSMAFEISQISVLTFIKDNVVDCVEPFNS